MKKVLLAGAIALATLSGTAMAKDWKVVRIGVEGAYPPFSWTDQNGDVVGFDVDVAKAMCAEMQVTCELVKQDWDGIIPALLARKYDAIIAAMSITEERKRKVSFTEKYGQSPNRFVAPKAQSYEFTPEGLKGLKVGVQRATTHDKYVSDNYGKDVKVVRYGSADEAYLDLKAGRLDMIMADGLAIQDGLLNKDGGDAYQFVGPSVVDRRWFGEGMGIAIRKQDKELVQMFNQAIDAVQESGVYEQLSMKYLGMDISGR